VCSAAALPTASRGTSPTGVNGYSRSAWLSRTVHAPPWRVVRVPRIGVLRRPSALLARNRSALNTGLSSRLPGVSFRSLGSTSAPVLWRSPQARLGFGNSAAALGCGACLPCFTFRALPPRFGPFVPPRGLAVLLASLPSASTMLPHDVQSCNPVWHSREQDLR
jgi:hypothetical protein